jgi:REP element-mobilizing transposase RayT
MLSPEAPRRRHWMPVITGTAKKMKCYAACVMPDHVHLLIQPLPVQAAGKEGVHSLAEILHSIKSFSAHEVNKVMKRTGPVWQEESFDRMIRSEATCMKNGITSGTIRANLDWSGRWRNILTSGRQPPVWVAFRRPAKCFDFSSPRRHRFSGKTEVYLQAIAHALEQGKGAIVLVPEISLTPQTVERFKARFSSGKLQTLVAVLHSHLSAGERHDEWHKIRQGRARIVIGARSAIFAPVEPLGLIIVDEEHEHSYKQEEAPRYHARDVAIMRGQMENAVVVLGSATPSLESYYNCKKGKYTLLELPERVDDQKMPHVRVVDMRQAASQQRGKEGIPIFSPQLKEAITQRLERGSRRFCF